METSSKATSISQFYGRGIRRDRQVERQADRKTDGQIDKQMDEEMKINKQRQTDAQTESYDARNLTDDRELENLMKELENIKRDTAGFCGVCMEDESYPNSR